MEAIYEFEVEDMPVTVAVDNQGNSIHRFDKVAERAQQVIAEPVMFCALVNFSRFLIQILKINKALSIPLRLF